MEQKFISISTINVAYLEKNETAGNVVFFIHGNSGSSGAWLKQFNSPLFYNYHLIAFDLPGCGKSTVADPLNWDYSPLATGKIVAEAVQQLSKGKPYALVGHSYGTNVIGEMLQHDIAPIAISLSAPCITGVDYPVTSIFSAGDFIFFHDKLGDDVVKAFFSEILVSPGEEDIRNLTTDFFLAKPPFRSALIQSVIAGKMSDEIAAIKKQAIPVQLIFGEQDSLLQINYLDTAPLNTWRNTVSKLPKAGHFLQTDNQEGFNTLLSAYFEERFTTISKAK